MAVQTKKVTLAGFSKRLNELLNEAEYPPLEYGRARYLANQFGVSKSGARKWIREDTPPRHAMLRRIVEALYERTKIKKLAKTANVISWLQFGDEIVTTQDNEIVDSPQNHLLMSNIYIAVHNAARKLKVDLESLSANKLDKLYSSVINDTVEQDQNQPDAQLIEKLLKAL